MTTKHALIFSLSIHFMFIFIFLINSPDSEVLPEEEKINIELVTKKEKKSVEVRDVKGGNVDIISGNIDIEVSITKPKNSTYTDSFITNEPDLVLQNNILNSEESSIFLGLDMNEFESSLTELMPEPVFFEEEDQEDNNLDITWDGLTRDITRNSNIDFSSFPKESFTGVGVDVEFMVNSEGEVFSVKVNPPGSGSVEFDILIKTYVENFIFNKSEETSKGEIFIVYKK